MSEFTTDGAFSNTSKRQNAGEIARALNEQLEKIPAMLGQTDIHETADEIRVGRNGHISIVRRDGGGKRRGWWTDFKADIDGTDMLDYVTHIMGTSTAGAMRWAADCCTIYSSTTYEPPKAQTEEDRKTGLVKKIRYAGRIWQETKPLAGTVGETYLREIRGITCPVGSIVRFHPHLYHKGKNGEVTHWPAIVAAVMISPGHHLTGIWRIYLSPDGEKAPISPQKMGLGATIGHGGAVRLTNAASSHLYIAEGLENGLAALSLKPGIQIWCAMAVSGFGKMAIPQHVEHITILADNDPPNSEAYRSLINGSRELRKRIPRVGIVRPSAKFKDINDVLLGREI